MMLILILYEYDVRFQLFVSFSVSSFSVLSFSEYRSFTSLVEFIPRYLIFFVSIVNGFVFLPHGLTESRFL